MHTSYIEWTKQVGNDLPLAMVCGGPTSTEPPPSGRPTTAVNAKEEAGRNSEGVDIEKEVVRGDPGRDHREGKVDCASATPMQVAEIDGMDNWRIGRGRAVVWAAREGARRGPWLKASRWVKVG